MKYFVSIGGRETGIEVEGDSVTVGGRTVTATLERLPGSPLVVLTMDGRPATIPLERAGRGRWTVSRHGERHEVEVVDERTRHIRSLAGTGAAAPSGGLIRAPMPGLVVPFVVFTFLYFGLAIIVIMLIRRTVLETAPVRGAR